MKILFCTNVFEKVSNGPAKFAHLLLEEGAKNGIDAKILTEDIEYSTRSVYRLDLRIPRAFKLLGQFIRMWKYHKAAMRIRRDFNFDILVYNNAIVGLVSAVLFENTLGMINDDNNAHSSLAAIIKGRSVLNKRLVFFYVEYFCCRLYTKIIVNSEYLKKALIHYYNCSPSLLAVMMKGIEGKFVTIDRKLLMKEKIPRSILFVKTDYERGGLFTLVEALKTFNEPIKFTIVGPPLEKHEKLKKLFNNNVKVEVYDYLPPNEIFREMRKSEIFCVPSKLEAFGVANLEAMAMGCKIVTTDVGGIPEALGGRRFAWLVKPSDSAELSNALKVAFNTSIEEDMDDLCQHLNQFSSTALLLRFKEILSKC